jgi:hypothetical protein
VDFSFLSWQFPEEKPFFQWILVYKLVIPGKITIYPVEGECWQSADEILLMYSSSLSW